MDDAGAGQDALGASVPCSIASWPIALGVMLLLVCASSAALHLVLAGSSPTKIVALGTGSGRHPQADSQDKLALAGMEVASTDANALGIDPNGRIQDLNTNTPVAPSATPSWTSTPTATQSPSSTSTPTDTPSDTTTLTETATATPSDAPTATSTVQNCQLLVSPNAQTVVQGAAEAILYTTLPGTTITTTILGATYPVTATVSNGPPNTPGSLYSGTPVTTPMPGGYRFVVVAGPDGHALLDFPIPATAAIGSVSVLASADGNGCLLSNSAAFNVAGPAISLFKNQLLEPLHHGLIRTVQPPPANGSRLTDRVQVMTTPGAAVGLQLVIKSLPNPNPNLGSGFAPGQLIFTATTNADAQGIALFTVPLTSTLLIPGRAMIIQKTATVNSGGDLLALKTSFSLREVSLRLIVLPQETSRGGKRPIFQLGHTHNGGRSYSVFRVLVLADPGATISALATFGTLSLAPAEPPQPIRIGGGRRVLLQFNVPNTVAPPAGHAQGSVTVTSTFRGASSTRTVHFAYDPR